MLAIALACAASSLPRYERENDDEKLSFDVGAEPGKPPRERRRRERRIVERDDDAHAVAAVLRETGDVRRRAHLQQRLLDDVARRAVERSGGRPGNGDGSEERGEER